MKEKQLVESKLSESVLEMNSLSERKEKFIKFKSKLAVAIQNTGGLDIEEYSALNYEMDGRENGTKINDLGNTFEGNLLHLSFIDWRTFEKEKQKLYGPMETKIYAGCVPQTMVRLCEGDNTEDDLDSNNFFEEIYKNQRYIKMTHDDSRGDKLKSRNNPGKYLKIGDQEFELGLDILGQDRSLYTSHTFIDS